jgi:hypothetical protein
VDVGGFAEPRKILCQCALPSYEQISVHPRSAHGGAGIPQHALHLEEEEKREKEMINQIINEANEMMNQIMRKSSRIVKPTKLRTEKERR